MTGIPPAVLDVAGRALYVAAVRAYSAGDKGKHRLLNGISGSIGACALGLQRAMADDRPRAA
jgi:hypothetical protein